MKAVGGFFELEFSTRHGGYHDGAQSLYTGRACFHAIIREVKPTRVYLPFLICDSVIEPLQRTNTAYRFYSVDENFELSEEIKLGEGEFILYVNYWGLKRDYIAHLTNRYGTRLIIDNTQAYFEKAMGKNWSFNSARKFFGVPDGAYLYGPKKLDLDVKPNETFTIDHLVDRFVGKQEAGYDTFLKHEASLNADLRDMSQFSRNILETIDYRSIIEKRRHNFKTVHANVSSHNTFPFVYDPMHDVPFVYPLLLSKPIDKSNLYPKKIFLSVFWKDVIARDGLNGFDTDRKLAYNLVPIPIDHRYDDRDVLQTVKEILALCQ